MTRSILLKISILSLFSIPVFSQNGKVNIDTIYFNIDTSNRIILVNQNTEGLNSNPELKNCITSDGINYTFTTPVQEFKTGVAYQVSDIQGTPYDLYFSQLPVINITTSNIIADEPRVYALFQMCEQNGNFIKNPIGIEYRGGWTQSLPKKSLRIEFWNDVMGNETKDFSLLGMRSDDDWNLQAMFNEPLRLRSKVSYELWRKIDSLYYIEYEPDAINGVKQEYVELFVNKEYRGLYALSERIDRKQLKLKKFKDGEIRGELYKGVTWGSTTFTSLTQPDNKSTIWGGFEYRHPEEEINWVNIYEFVRFVMKEDDFSFYENIGKKFITDNAVNYFIFLNLLRAVDNTGKNIFIARYIKDEPYFYVPYDLDGTFGTIWNGTKEDITDDILVNGLYKRLISGNSDNDFPARLKSRWNELKTSILSVESIINSFSNSFDYLEANGVYERELKVWQDCDFFDYNNIDYTKKWLTKRFNYLDMVFNNPELLTNTRNTWLPDKTTFKIYPNPAGKIVHFEVADHSFKLEKISIVNLSGNLLIVKLTDGNNGSIDVSNLNEGLYLIVADFKNGYRQAQKLIISK